jgi:hypothetical protein
MSNFTIRSARINLSMMGSLINSMLTESRISHPNLLDYENGGHNLFLNNSCLDNGGHYNLTTLRLERACKLLQETTLNLEDIAEKCGYRNGSYISRLFVKKLQTTPSEFRAAHRL